MCVFEKKEDRGTVRECACLWEIKWGNQEKEGNVCEREREKSEWGSVRDREGFVQLRLIWCVSWFKWTIIHFELKNKIIE